MILMRQIILATNMPVFYDEKIRKVIRGYNEMHDLSYYLLKDNLPEDAKILVVGIGTGHEAIKYAENQEGWHIVGVDPTQKW